MGEKGTGDKYGSYNYLFVDDTAHQYGTYQFISGNGNGKHYGTYNNLSGGGTEEQFGFYSKLTGTGTGSKYGIYSYIPSGTGGTCYGIYSDARNSGDFSGYFKGTMYIKDSVGIGTENPDKKLHIRVDVADLIYALKIDNHNSTIGSSSVGVLFTAGGGTNRGKGALVYKVTDTWNRGSYQFLQDKNGNSGVADLNDAVVTIDNNGKVGIGKTSPAVKLHIVGGTDASLSDGSGFLVVGEESSTNIVMDNNEIIARNNGSGSTLYIQGSNSEGNTIINADTGMVCILNNTPYTTHGLTLRNRDFHEDYTGWAISSGWHTYSSKKSKVQYAAIDNGLATILKLNPVRFQEKGIEDVGFDPEELYNLVPNAATLPPRNGIYKDVWGVNTNKVIPLFVNAVQQQQQIIDKQNKKIDNLQKRLDRLENLIEKQ